MLIKMYINKVTKKKLINFINFKNIIVINFKIHATLRHVDEQCD